MIPSSPRRAKTWRKVNSETALLRKRKSKAKKPSISPSSTPREILIKRRGKKGRSQTVRREKTEEKKRGEKKKGRSKSREKSRRSCN